MIIVTGAAGFIGSATVWKLNQMGRRDLVLVDDLLKEEKWRNLLGKSYEHLYGVNEFRTLIEENSSFMKSASAVIHMGACSSTTERDGDFLRRNNIDDSKMLWNFCERKGIPYIYASSAATYGLGETGYSDEDSVTPSLRPINAYGWSKQVVDEWALTRNSTPPFWAGLKFFNVYGPNEYHKGSMKSLVCKAVPQINESGKLKLFRSHKDGVDDGEQKRDFVYVKDVVDVIWHLLESSFSGRADVLSGIYNIGTGQARSFADLGRATFAALERETQFDWIDMPESIRHQYQYFTEADMTKLRRDAKYDSPFYSLEEGVSDYVKNYLAEDLPSYL